MFTGTQVIKGVGIFIGVFGLTIVCLALSSIPTTPSTNSILEKAEKETALKFATNAANVCESKHTTLSEKIAAVSMAATACRLAYPDKPSMWEPLVENQRVLEEMQQKEIKARIANW